MHGIDNGVMVFFTRNYRKSQYSIYLVGFCRVLALFGFFTVPDC